MVVFLSSALLIFLMRIVDVSLGTIRLIMVVRGRKIEAWILAFFNAIVFVLVIQRVLSNIDNWINILGYATGFATGMVVGMWIEGKIAVGHTHLRIISSRRGAELAQKLRAEGYAVTEIDAQGLQGTVSLLNCDVRRRRAVEVQALVARVDPSAFVTAERVRSIQRGFWRR
jgi:uncharacterized protein YebE (UPF0316 family)